MTKPKPNPKARNDKQPFMSLGYWYDAAFAPSKRKPPKKPSK